MIGRSNVLAQGRRFRRGTTRRALFSALVALFIATICSAPPVHAQERREREPNSSYAARRAKLASEVDAPILLWGLTGREEFSMAYVFEQENNFYYLTGHNEEGAGLIILPSQKNGANPASGNGPQEMLFLPPKNPRTGKMERLPHVPVRSRHSSSHWF